MKRKRGIQKAAIITVLTVVAVVYIYPVFLMFMNSFKPFGEIVSDAIAIPTKMEWENYTYVIDKIDYPKLFIFSSFQIRV